MHIQTAFLEALGWTLLNSWWQMGLLWGTFLLLKKGWPALSAAILYNIALVLLLAGMLWSAVTFVQQLSMPGNLYQRWTISGGAFASGYNTARQCLPYLSMVYLAWLALRLLHFMRLYGGTSRLRKDGLYKAPVDWRLFVDRMAMQMNIRRPFTLWLSDKVNGPLLLGWLKPVILLPFSAVSQLAPDQVEAILIHEMAHIRRNDFFWNMVLSVAALLFYYNPFARRLLATISAEREHACDDWVMQFPIDRVAYAGALLKLEQQRQTVTPPIVLAAGGPHTKLLLSRVKRILALPGAHAEPLRATGPLLAVLALLLILVTVQPRQETGLFFQELTTAVAPENSAPAPPETVLAKNAGTIASPARSSAPHMPSPRSSENTDFPEDPATTTPELSTAGWTNDPAANGQLVLETKLTSAVKAFSFVQPDIALQYPADIATEDGQPYVPAKSFEFSQTEDSLAQRLTSLKSKKAVVQVQLALKKLNWDKLESKLRNAGFSGAGLRYELERELSQLDWNQLSRESEILLQELNQQQAAVLQKEAARLQKAAEQYQGSIHSYNKSYNQAAADSLQRLRAKRKTIYF